MLLNFASYIPIACIYQIYEFSYLSLYALCVDLF
jgi:hypothetical protein